MIARILSILITVMISSMASANLPPFDREGFNQAVNSDKRVVLMVHESWCGHCFSIQLTLLELRNKQPFKSMVFYKFPRDIDDGDIRFKYKQEVNEKYVAPFIKINTSTNCDFSERSTLVVINKNKVIACETFQTDADKIAALLLTEG